MLVYSFRTYPHIQALKRIFPDVFIFGKLQEDMKAFEQLLKNSPDNVLGIASTDGQSRIETTAINKFNKGKLDKYSPAELKLFVDPRLKYMKLAQRPTTTFCNWTMYKTQAFIDAQKLCKNFTFIHLNQNDLDKLKALI